uniref:Uncharacterized protein n=1 Tax=Mus musculus TaxID=10090 RepID=Q9D8B0_MOUSE|nr:unnamed protein product [Mus musculus]
MVEAPVMYSTNPENGAYGQLHSARPPKHVGGVPSLPVFLNGGRCLPPAHSFWTGPGLDYWASPLRIWLLHRRPYQSVSRNRGLFCPFCPDGHHRVICFTAFRLDQHRIRLRVQILPPLRCGGPFDFHSPPATHPDFQLHRFFFFF